MHATCLMYLCYNDPKLGDLQHMRIRGHFLCRIVGHQQELGLTFFWSGEETGRYVKCQWCTTAPWTSEIQLPLILVGGMTYEARTLPWSGNVLLHMEKFMFKSQTLPDEDEWLVKKHFWNSHSNPLFSYHYLF
jgi:hypothetical protein